MSVVEDNVLEAIHYTLKHHNYDFSNKQLARADEYIIPFIGDLGIEEKEFLYKIFGAPKLIHDKRVLPLIVKYFAYLQDNINLYNELVDDKYILIDGIKIKFYALDRMLTNNFKRNEYKNLLTKYEDVLSSFYYSLRRLESDKREKCAKDFSDIVHIDHTTLNVGNNGEDGLSHYNFLNAKNILLFGKEFLLKISKKQREIINNINFNYDENDVLKIKELFTKYPDFNNDIPLSSEILHLFSVDEINSMNLKDYVLYEISINNNVLDRMKEILKLDPEFYCSNDFIKEEIFRVLSNEEIIELSEEAKELISNIKIPQIDNVLVMPVKKIHKILLNDRKKRSKENKSSTGSIKK